MASFEESMRVMAKLSFAEQKAKIRELDMMCICARCPTYVKTGEKRLTLCVSGKSAIIKKENGCICPACPVQKNLGLRWNYYCTRGSGREHAGMK